MINLVGEDYHSYYAKLRKLQEARVNAIYTLYPDGEGDFANQLTSAAMRMMGESFSFDRSGFRGPALRATRQYLLDLFGQGGIFENVRIDEITFRPCEIVWAPLLHLMADDQTKVPALHKPLMAYLGRIQLESDTDDPKSELGRLQLYMLILSTRLSHVDHDALMAESRRSFLVFMRRATSLQMLLPDGRLDRLVSWDVPMTQVVLKLEEALIKQSPLSPTDFERFRRLLSKIYATASRTAEPVPDELKTRLEESLLRESLNGYIRWPEARETYQGLLVEEVASCRQALSLAQWIAVLDIAGASKAPDSAIVALQASSPKEILWSIKKAYNPAHRSRMIRLCGMEVHVHKVEMLQLDAKAFSNDLGV